MKSSDCLVLVIMIAAAFIWDACHPDVLIIAAGSGFKPPSFQGFFDRISGGGGVPKKGGVKFLFTNIVMEDVK